HHRGDLRGAAQTVLDAGRRLRRPVGPRELMVTTHLALLDKQPQAALAALQEWQRQEPAYHTQGPICLVAGGLNMRGLPGKTLKALPAKLAPGRLAAMFRNAGGGKLDLPAVDQLLAREKGGAMGACCYLVGRYLEYHGQPQQALTYYRRSAA